MNKNEMFRTLKTMGILLFSSLIYAVAMNTFVNTGSLFPGGYSGISQILSRSLFKFWNISIPFGVFFFGLNIITTIFVFKYIGKKFALYSVFWFTCSSLLTSILPTVIITQDPLLISVFGGLFGGLAIGLALRNNASSGGTDFIAVYMSGKYNMPTWNYVLYFNAFILIIAGILFGWNQALYSIIYQFVSTQVVSTLHKRYKLTELLIITDKPDEVCDKIFATCRHGVTRLWGEGGYSHMPKCLLMMTVSTYQVHDIIEAIKMVDPKVFINISTIDKVVGNYYQKPLE